MKKSLALIMAAFVALFAVVTLTVTAFADEDLGGDDVGRNPTTTTTTTTTKKDDTTTTKKDDSTTSTTAKDAGSTKATEKDADPSASVIGDTEWAGQTKATTKAPAASVDSAFPNTGANGASIAVFVSLALAGAAVAVVATKKHED